MSGNPLHDPKAALHRYLTVVREAILWKVEGLSEYEIRRPMTPTGTNVLGVVKHLAAVQIGYLGWTFGRAKDVELDWWSEDAEPNADMFAAEEETREEILALYATAGEIGDATIAELDLDTRGHVPWWAPEGNPVTLHLILVHLLAETNRHAGHIDIVRELIDGQAGLRAGSTNLPGDLTWPEYRARLETLAARFR